MKSRFTLLSLALLSLAGCGETKTEEITVQEEKPIQVKTQELSLQTIARNVEYSSTLEGYETMNVAPSVTGNIEKINVEVGDKVKSGEILVVMDQKQLRSAKLQYANAKKDLSRMEVLYESEAISQQTYDQVKLAFDTASENMSFLDSNTFVRARFAGVITAKNYEDGELYSGQPILTLSTISTLKSLIGIPESYYPVVKKGMKVNVVADIYPDKVFPATVEIVYPVIDESSHTFQIKLRIPNTSDLLRPGMYIRVKMSMGDVEALVVPYQSVLKLIGSNERYVFIEKDGVVKQIFVKLGGRYDDKVEIISDEIHPGDRLVTVGQAKLIDGMKVNVVK
ncbi:MAG: efflux RND transporter periplasmic adaptor subunit [Alistipes sp.]|nr:efflux RND transporter periplasmic adaptor subunit [Candidatus Minthomonas equi]